MTVKYVTFSYGSFDGDDNYTRYELQPNGRVVKVTRKEHHLPIKEETNMTVTEFEAMPHLYIQ